MLSLIKYAVYAMITLSISSCNVVSNMSRINGEGPVKTETMMLDDFSELSISNTWNVILVPSNENKLVIQANENLIDLLIVEEQNNTLNITAEEAIGQADAKRIEIYYSTQLTKLKCSAGVEVNSPQVITFDELDFSISSGAEVILDLKGNELDLSVSSGSESKLTVKANQLWSSSSSGSELKIHVDAITMLASASSGSEIEASGIADKLEVKASSGSEIEAENLKANSVIANASSGSSIDVFPVSSLVAKASSGGDIDYHNKPKANTSISTSSGGSVSLQ